MQINNNSSASNTNILATLVQDLICNKFMVDVIKEIKIEGERIVSIVTIDGEDVIRAPIALNSNDLQVILREIMACVGEFCRRNMRGCRVKSQELSLLEITDQYNIQFLLAINKVDFSNYTSISIQNMQQNKDSLKQYLKIMYKDTRKAIQKLRQPLKKQISSFETIILQNIIN